MNGFRFARFAAEDEGAVTVDWVVLSAAVVGLCLAAFGTIKSGTASLSSKLNNTMSSMSINSTF
jgi:Flp pilus assembly pilin Flp